MNRNISEILKKETNEYEREAKLLREEIKHLRETQKEREEKSNSNIAETAEVNRLREELEQERKNISAFKEWAENKIKTQLHEILELKGAIRVITRVKPFISQENIVISEDLIEIPCKSFVSRCNKVLPPRATQEDLFAEVEDLVYSTCKGYRISILAYGPTGSGKTYSMEGPEQPSREKKYNSIVHKSELGGSCRCMECSDRGIVYRSMQTLKNELYRMESLGYTYRVNLSVVELYNDRVIKSVEGIKELDMIEEAYRKVSKSRKIGGTECNSRSSRSHLILTVDVVLEKETECGTKEYIEGSLCIVDLAGSERLNHSKAEGERLKETVEINKSLTALGDVVYSIASGAAHIPYRNSKLTTLLKNTLGPGAKTAFIINVDPGASIEETVTALRFANRLQECRLGRSKAVAVELRR